MRPHVVATFVLGLLSLGSSAITPARAEQKLRMLSHRDRLYDVTSVGDRLFVVGHPGRVLRSRDIGKTFESMNVVKHDEALFSVAFNAKGEGAIVGRSGVVLMSADKGDTWTSTVVDVDKEKPSLFSVDVLGDGTIVAVGDFGIIVRSTDHGKTWSRSSYAAELPADAPTCTGGPAGGGDNADSIGEARLTDVEFVNDQQGYLVGEFGLVARTDDGGLTFKRQNSCTDRLLYSVAVVTPTRLLAVGADGTAIESTDGGTTWAALPTGTIEHLFGVFADAQRAVVVGAAGTVLARSGEGPLSLAKTDVHSWLAGAWLDGKGQGVIVGGRAFVLSTRDGAKTQTLISGE
ncbi:MAG: hypothetical protein RLZZ450_2969 [Pseudomonadota bacterium]|jgi:photosystem II stability/assembly factor-like uncharacterized protein